MLIIKVVRKHLHLQYVAILLTCTVSFTNPQYVQNFLRSAFDFGRRFQVEDVFSSAIDVSRGLLLSANTASIPSPAEFFDIGINFIVGYPTEQVFIAINTFCKFSSSQRKVHQNNRTVNELMIRSHINKTAFFLLQVLHRSLKSK